MLHDGLAASLEQAIAISDEGIRSCLPEGFNPENIVRPVIARRLGICGLCGKEQGLIHIQLKVGHGCLLCEDCRNAITNAENEKCENLFYEATKKLGW
jgi:hypothetical protein